MTQFQRMTTLEQDHAQAFEARHSTCYSKLPHGRHRIRYTFSATGVGTSITVSCRSCRKKKNITDYSNW